MLSEEVSESTVDSPLQNPYENESGESSLHDESGQGMAIEAPTGMATSHIRAQSELVSKHGRNGSTSQCKELFMSAEMPQLPMRRSFSVDSSFSISITDLHRSLEDGRLKPFPNENEDGVGVSCSGHLGNGGSEALYSVDEAGAGASSSVQPFKPTEENHLKVFSKQLDGDKNKFSMKRSLSGGRFFFLRNGRALQNGIKKLARLEEKDEDFLMMMQQTQQLDNNLLLVSPTPLSQLDEGCFLYSFNCNRSGEGQASNVEPPLSIDLSYQMLQQEEEINTLIKSQNEEVIKWVLEMKQRHLQEIFGSVEQRISMILKDKDVDLENLRRRNFQLQALTKQLSMEALMWQKVAKNNEVMVGKLKNDLEQLVAQIRDQKISRERSGDVDDALSCSCYPQDHSTLYKYHGNGKGKLTMKEAEENNCKVCRMKSSCIVLLPCRHVCVCADCEMEVIACPLCNSLKSASIQAHMS